MQQAFGSNIAQASGGSTANVNVYEHVPPQPVDEAKLERALHRLSELPLDTLPDPSQNLPYGSRMLLTRNPLFVGREQDLKRLAKALKAGDTAAISPVAAATGIGGIGKTQLATEFVFRYGRYFDGGVFWLSFADPAAVPADVAFCRDAALPYLPPNFSALPLDDQLHYVLSAWQSPLPRLLIFDNCEDEALLARWRPPVGGCRVLLTSRRTQWDRSLAVSSLPLGVLDREESIALLRKFRSDLTVDDPTLDAIASELGDLPLALHLAGSFLDLQRYGYSVSPTQYLTQLRNPKLLHHPSLTGHRLDISPTKHDLHVGRTFALGFDRLDTSHPTDILALKLLARAAHLAPGEPIPRDLLKATLSAPQRYEEIGDSPLESQDESDSEPEATVEALHTEDALARLSGLGLLEVETQGALRLHRLLGVFARSAYPDQNAQPDVEKTLLVVANDLNKLGYPGQLLELQPHLRFATEIAQKREDELATYLCSELGYHLKAIGNYATARPLYERALAIDEKLLGPEHPNTALSMNNLASVLTSQGDYAAARPLLERALAINEKVFGPEHPDTAASMNNLASVLTSQGDYAAARPLLERALAINEKVFGPEHPDTAHGLNNLAYLLKAQGDYATARPLYERALAIDEKLLGPEHPNTALSMNNLASVLTSQGDYAAARPLLERALAINEKVFGPEHPDTAASMNNLASVPTSQGDYAAARPLLERALAINEKVFGPEHPDTARSLNNLAVLNAQMGDFDVALKLMQRALSIRETRLGLEHPDTRRSRLNLGAIKSEMRT